MKIGVGRDSSTQLSKYLKLDWSETIDSLSISYNVNDMNNITEMNLMKKLKEIFNSISVWKPRCLTIYCKIMLIKSNMMSKITRIMLF